MYVFAHDVTELGDWVRSEVVPAGRLTVGAGGAGVKRVQEWLNLHGIGIVVDGSFGPVTRQAVTQFQTSQGLPVSGDVDAATYARLVEPMVSVLQRRNNAGPNLPAALLAYAAAHLAVHPIEVGGQNCGPWVRLYTQGHEGAPWAWCAGFVSFLMRQAAETLGLDPPIRGSVSCDSLAAQARDQGRFRTEAEARQQGVPDGSIFLVRRTSTDWTHTGIVTGTQHDAFTTVEGNTNDEGSREGFEVCARLRGYADKDFILLG